MMRMKTVSVAGLLLLLATGMAVAQETGKIDEEIHSMIEDHPLRLGIFRVGPRLVITSGYDSNAFNEPGAVPVDDYFTLVAPGAAAAVKLGHRGYIEIEELLNFQYYNNQENLRDTFNTTALRVVTGSRRILFKVQGAYAKRKTFYNYEYDLPVDQKSTTGGASLEFQVRRTTELGISYTLIDEKFQEIEGVVAPIPPPPDYRSQLFNVSLSQDLGDIFSFTVEGGVGQTKFLDEVRNETSKLQRVLAGFTASGRKLSGRIEAGWGITDPGTGQPKLNDLLIDTELLYTLGRRLTFGPFLQRHRIVSAVIQNGFSLTTYGGVKGSFPLSHRFFIDGKFTIGKNDYDQEVVDQAGQPISKDNFQQYDAGVNFEAAEHVVIRVGGSFQNRDSNALAFTKDRFTLNAGLILEP